MSFQFLPETKKVITIHTPKAAQYGDEPGGEDKARQEWLDQMGANDAEQAGIASGMSYADKVAADPGKYRPNAEEDAGLAGQFSSGASGHQQGAIGLARSMASGQAPSQGAYQLQAGLTQGLAQQRAMAGSARGGAALATAGSNQGYNASNMQQNAYTAGGLLRSQDMAAGAGMYGTLAGQQREQAAARLGMGNEMAQFNAEGRDKYGLQMGQAGIGFGDAGNMAAGRDLSNYGQGMNPIKAQTEANQGGQSWKVNTKKTINANNAQEDN